MIMFQFYLKEQDIGAPRGKSCVNTLAGLNTTAKVQLVEENIDAALLSSQRYQVLDPAILRVLMLPPVFKFSPRPPFAISPQIVVMTESNVAEQVRVNGLCRQFGLKFIAADVRGLAAFCFTDFGDKFVVSDATGENPVTNLIEFISQEENGIVTVHEKGRHGLTTGDLVVFEEVEGMTPLNDLVPRRIKEVKPFQFSIGDTRGFPEYTVGGRYRQVKQPVEMTFQSLATQLAEPTIEPAADMAKFDGPYQQHWWWQALSQFQTAHGGRLPRADSWEEAKEVVELTKTLAAASSMKPDLNENSLLRLSRCASACLGPMAALLGGIVAQEAMKAASGKFKPFQQFWYYDAIECLPDDDLKFNIASFAPANSYDWQFVYFSLMKICWVHQDESTNDPHKIRLVKASRGDDLLAPKHINGFCF